MLISNEPSYLFEVTIVTCRWYCDALSTSYNDEWMALNMEQETLHCQFYGTYTVMNTSYNTAILIGCIFEELKARVRY